MSLWKKILGLGDATANAVEDAIDSRYGVQIHEANIRSAKEKLNKAIDRIDTLEAQAKVQKKDIESYEAQKAEYEANIEKLKGLHDKEKEAGNEAKAAEFRSLAIEANNEIKKLTQKFAPQIQAYELTIESVQQARAQQEEFRAEIESEEALIATYHANQELLNVHKANQELTQDLEKTSVGASGAVSKLAKRQQEELAKMEIQRNRNKESSTTLQDKIKAATSNDSDDLGW